jgi:hypothetical protein
LDEVTRKEIFQRAAKKLRQDFDELYSIPHSAVRGGEAEKIVKEFLEQHLPRRFAVGSGFIIDPEDAMSKQTDVIIYDAFNCPTYRASEEASIFPSDNVASVIEVKSRLTNTELRSAWENIHKTKSLRKRITNAPAPLRSQTLGCIFAFNSDMTLETISDNYRKLMIEFGIGFHPDVILVLDKAVFTLACHIPSIGGWNPMSFEGFGGEAGEGSHLAISYVKTGEDSLDHFLRLLLANLNLFRGIMDHPGFDWSSTQSKGLAHINYITSCTNEKDPKKREQRLLEYREHAKKQLQGR